MWHLVHNIQLALQLHPDKNGAPGADEAFKSRFNFRASSANLTLLLFQWFHSQMASAFLYEASFASTLAPLLHESGQFAV